MSCTDTCIDMDTGDCDTDFWVERTPRAAKGHRCVECRREILKGERYQRVNGMSDGDFWSLATCTECAEIRKTFCCRGWLAGELWASIYEQMFPAWDAMKAIDCLALLTTDAAVAKLRAEYAEWQPERTPGGGQ